MIEFIYFFFLFLIGTSGVFLSRKNLILTVMSLELMFLSINLFFIFFALYLDDIIGIIFSLIILALSAVEASIGLSLVVSSFFLSIKKN